MTQRDQHRTDVAQSATADRVAARIGPDGKIIIEKGAFVGRASAYGSGSMGGGTGSLAITHAFGREPDPSQIIIVPTSANGTGWYVDTITSTQFTVHRPSTSGTFTFSWAVNPV